jgi:serine/threonine protein kinase
MDAPSINPGDDLTIPNPDGYHPSAVARARELLEEMPARIGRYRILERIGGGGMGEVYVAEQTEPIKRRVAIKVIKAGMDTKQVVARFEAERQALAMMDHPNIARVFDAGATDTGRPYFVMELVRGVPITRFCDDNKLSTRQRVELLVPVCQAVQHAHQKGIIHRDIKPHNVLVTLHDGKPVPKVIDFGIAKATSQPLTDKTVYTEFRAMIGTPAYMSPEQAEMSGLDIDTRSDIYSLGVLAYELLTGALPFDSDRLVKAGLGEIQRIIREEEPPRPSLRFSTLGAALAAIASHRGAEPARLSKLLAGELDWIVMRAMEKDRRRRYDTATDLAADFTRHLTGEPVMAAPPTWAYRTQKFVKRNKGAVITAAAVTTALTLGVVGTTTMSFEAKHQAVLAGKAATRESARADGEAKARDAAELESYISSLGFAQTEIAIQRWPEARAGLDACPASKRGWEWNFLRKQAGIILQSFGPARDFILSKDGKKILVRRADPSESSGQPSIVQMLDAVTGSPIGEPFTLPN